jgi:uncharacterized protein (TIGR02118 family)
MVVRCVYLEGTVDGEDRERFDRFMVEEILPLMKRFPGAVSARIMRQLSVEDGGRPLYMTFETVYPSLEALEYAFTQPIRKELKAKLSEIMPLFGGRMFHITQELLGE